MTPPTPLQDFQCPRCGNDVHTDWTCCPKCGFWLKREGPLMLRLAAWGLVLSAFVLAISLIARHDRDGAIVFGVMFGLPLAYVLGKAILFRMQGRPLTYQQLVATSFKAIGVAVVLPWLIGASLLILLCVLCFGALGISAIGS